MTWFNLTGDARLGRCDTEGCGGQPTWRLETCGIGSNYCSGCKEIIASPTPRCEVRSGDELEPKRSPRYATRTADDNLLSRLDDQGLFSKADRIQMIKDAAAEIRRLRGAAQEASNCGADSMIGEIEKRFPNWKSYRDLVDCIDVTLHQLSKQNETALTNLRPPAKPFAWHYEQETPVFRGERDTPIYLRWEARLARSKPTSSGEYSIRNVVPLYLGAVEGPVVPSAECK